MIPQIKEYMMHYPMEQKLRHSDRHIDHGTTLNLATW